MILTNATKTIDVFFYFFIISFKVSHWGNINIDTFSKLVNLGSKLSGEFGRIDY